MERFLNWLSSKGQDAKGWRANFWYAVNIVACAVVLPPMWLFGKRERQERRENGERWTITLGAIWMLWLMVWGLIAWPWRWFDMKFIWPHTKKGKAVAEEYHAVFKAQLENCKKRKEEESPEDEGDYYNFAFACWLDFIRDFREYPWHLQRGWDLLKEMFPEVAENYVKAYPAAMEALGIRR
jgi:hypothetical protein